MISKVYSTTVIGFEGKRIEVECDASQGLPSMVIVGLGNKAIDEARERVRSAIKNSGLEFPLKRVTVNLAPANLPKDGAHFDLPIAAALLAVSGQIPQESLTDTLLVGELALDGSLRPIRGVINCAETAVEANIRAVIVPRSNAEQALLVKDVAVLPADNLEQVYMHLSGTSLLQPAAKTAGHITSITKPLVKLDDIKGQEKAKRALVIAAAGHHNILLSGPPGAGKTMLAKALLSVLPPLTQAEMIEVTKLYSIGGESHEEVVTSRPFRSPHHSASHTALVGGGQYPRPGEISLAHRGVLFLDELPEYSRQALEALRQPLEDRVIHISRAKERVQFPADFMLVATQNPCPCGYAGDTDRECSCSGSQLINYQKKISGPLLDRIDMIVEVSRIKTNKILSENTTDTEQETKKLIAQARQAQNERFHTPAQTNAHLNAKTIPHLAHLQPDAKLLLEQAALSLHLSARAYLKTIKVARTIADIEASPTITTAHIAEALQYRPRGEIAIAS